MNNKKTLCAPTSENIVTIEEHIKKSEVFISNGSVIKFDYVLSDKASKSKLLKAAKRIPIAVEENSTSKNLIFSAGAWYHTVLPSIKYFEDVHQDARECLIGDDYTIKVGGVKLGKESNGKHVNTQIVFFANREKIVCHLYNTTQLILINGNGHEKFVDLFLRPFFETVINDCLETIEIFNDEVITKLGPKTVKRSSIKLKRSTAYPCHNCSYAAKSVAGLTKHKKIEHITNLNLSKKQLEPRHSTRNNSVENIMLEDISITDLDKSGVKTIEESSLKYSCDVCKFTTMNKKSIDDHIKMKHETNNDEEVKYMCTICHHEFIEAEVFDSHLKTHELIQDKTELEFQELENLIHCQIIDYNRSYFMDCHKCKFKGETENQLNAHIQTVHTNPVTVMSEAANFEQNVVINPQYKCNFCDHTTETIEQIWNHKLAKHTEQGLDLNNMDKNKTQNLGIVLVENFNDLVEEVLNMKRTMKDIIGQLIDEFEDNMSNMREENTKSMTNTAKNLQNIQNKIDVLISRTNTTHQQSAASSNNSPKSSNIFSSTTSKSNEAQSTQNSYAENKHVGSKSSESKKKTNFQRRPKVLMVGDSVAHNTNFRIVEKVTNSTIKTAKAYSSVLDEKARFKHSNMTKIVKEELEKSDFDHLVIAAPTVDITNLNTKVAKHEDLEEPFKTKIETSCRNIFNIAENAIKNNPELKRVTIMDHPPRFDTAKEDPLSLKPKLAHYANNCLQKLWVESSYNENIMVGNHTLDCSDVAQRERFTDDRSRKYDGIHMYGSSGKLAYTDSLVNILLSSLETSSSLSSRTIPANNYHTQCPQTRYMEKQKKLYSSVVRENITVKTQNRFSPLSGHMGN